jgi:hypothetical protein
VEAPSLIEFIGGEPGLIEHILTFLANEKSASDERVRAGTSAVRFLHVCKRTKQIVTPALWNTLLATYYPNYPLPTFGFISVRTLFHEMWSRYNEFEKALRLYERLKADLDRAAQADADRHVFTYASARANWEIGESMKAAQSDMEWRASFLQYWDGSLKTVPVRRQNAGVAH